MADIEMATSSRLTISQGRPAGHVYMYCIPDFFRGHPNAWNRNALSGRSVRRWQRGQAKDVSFTVAPCRDWFIVRSRRGRKLDRKLPAPRSLKFPRTVYTTCNVRTTYIVYAKISVFADPDRVCVLARLCRVMTLIAYAYLLLFCQPADYDSLSLSLSATDANGVATAGPASKL